MAKKKGLDIFRTLESKIKCVLALPGFQNVNLEVSRKGFEQVQLYFESKVQTRSKRDLNFENSQSQVIFDQPIT